MEKDLRIALVSCSAAVGAIEDNAERLIQWLEQARKAKADIVCFPELCLSGYSLRPGVIRCSPEIDRWVHDTLHKAACHYRITVLAGWAAHNDEGKPWIAHMVVTPQGKIGVYRKTHLGPPERAAYTAAEVVPVFRIEHATVGIQLCYDAHFPDLTTIMAANGLDMLFVPHASPHGPGQRKIDSWKRHLIARAYDNAVFVMACNLSGTNDTGLSFPAAALAIDPAGHIIDGAAMDPEGMLVVDARVSAMHAVRNHSMRYFFPNRRPGLYGDRAKHLVNDVS